MCMHTIGMNKTMASSGTLDFDGNSLLKALDMCICDNDNSKIVAPVVYEK